MVMKTSIKQVPFNNGSLVEWAHGKVGELGGLTRDGSWYGPDEWRENKPFYRLLTVLPENPGYSSVKYAWKDADGHRFTMFGGSVNVLLRKATIKDGTCNGPWIFVKRGEMYALAYYEGEMP